MCFPCDSIRFARAGHVFRPQPSMLAPVLYTHPPQLGISRRSRAQSSRQASWTRCAKQKMAVLPFDATARRPATCVPTETRRRRRAWFPLARACQWIRAPRPSLTAPRATCTSGQAARLRALVINAVVPSGGAIGVGRAAAAWQQAAKRRAVPNLHLVGDSRGGCSPAARHGLGIRHELGSDAASGRIGRR